MPAVLFILHSEHMCRKMAMLNDLEAESGNVICLAHRESNQGTNAAPKFAQTVLPARRICRSLRSRPECPAFRPREPRIFPQARAGGVFAREVQAARNNAYLFRKALTENFYALFRFPPFLINCLDKARRVVLYCHRVLLYTRKGLIFFIWTYS